MPSQRDSFLLPEWNSEPDPELVAQGWKRRFTAGPVRAKEAVQLYRELGYEVYVKPVKPDELTDDCEDCVLATHFFVTIYIRKRGLKETDLRNQPA